MKEPLFELSLLLQSPVEAIIKVPFDLFTSRCVLRTPVVSERVPFANFEFDCRNGDWLFLPNASKR